MNKFLSLLLLFVGVGGASGALPTTLNTNQFKTNGPLTLNISATTNELNFVSGVTSAIQTQLNGKGGTNSAILQNAAVTGFSLIGTPSGSTNFLKPLLAGANVTITTNATNITIAASSGGGEVSFTNFNANQFGTNGGIVSIASGAFLTNPVVQGNINATNNTTTALNLVVGANTSTLAGRANELQIKSGGSTVIDVWTNGNINVTGSATNAVNVVTIGNETAANVTATSAVTGATVTGTTFIKGGALYLSVTNIGDAEYTVLANDYFITFDVSIDRTCYLPAATGSGRILEIKMLNAAGNPVNVTPSGGDTIDGAGGVFALTVQFEVLSIIDTASGVWSVR